MTYDPQTYGMVNLGGAAKQQGESTPPQQAEDILFAQDPSFAPDPDLPPTNQFGGSEPEATGNLASLLQGLPDLEVAGGAAAPAAAPAGRTSRPPRRGATPPAAASGAAAPASSPAAGKAPRRAPQPAAASSASQAAATGASAPRPDRFGQRPPSAAPRLPRRASRRVYVAPLLALSGLGASAWFWYGLQSLPFTILAGATGLVAGLLAWALLRR